MQMPEPYKSIADLPFDDQGWFLNTEELGLCLQIKPAKIVIEVGSWLGSSTRYIANQLPSDGLVYAVDTWLGSIENADDPRLPYLFQLFLSNVKHAGLAHKIIPIRMNSLEAAKALNVIADLIYIDASHDEESVFNDIMAWYPHLAPDGIICGDDGSFESVQRAAYRASQELNCEACRFRNFWWFKWQKG